MNMMTQTDRWLFAAARAGVAGDQGQFFAGGFSNFVGSNAQIAYSADTNTIYVADIGASSLLQKAFPRTAQRGWFAWPSEPAILVWYCAVRNERNRVHAATGGDNL